MERNKENDEEAQVTFLREAERGTDWGLIATKTITKGPNP